MQRRAEDAADFFKSLRFAVSSLHADITQAAEKTALLDDLSKLQVLVDAVKKAEYDTDVFTQTKTSAWYPFLAMFSVGTKKCSWLASGVQQSRLDATLSMDGGQSKGRVHAIFVCCAGALLGFAKRVAVLKQKVDTSTQARPLTESSSQSTQRL